MSGPRLRIAFDLSATRLGRAGVARSVRAMAEHIGASPEIDLVPIGAGDAPASGTARRRALALRLDLAWSTRGARSAAGAIGADVLHCPVARAPLTRGTPPTLVTVHDLVAIRHPETMTPWNRGYSRATLARVLTAADAIAAVSTDTAADIAAFVPAAAERTVVVLQGVDAFWSQPAPNAPTRERPYVLFVGSTEPRKNLPRLVAAQALRRARGADEDLVFVGGDGWGADELPDEPWLVRLGQLGDDDLRVLYRDAAAVAIPSLHEGAGLPALEAMAVGAPVVAAAAGALPETCGGAAVLVDPLDVASIADGIDRAIADRDGFVARGRAHAATRTWQATAAGYAELYRRVVGA